MKKLYTTPEYKRWHKRRLLKINRNRKEDRKAKPRQENDEPSYRTSKKKLHNYLRLPLSAPDDFRLIDNSQECLLFFRNLRSDEYTFNYKGRLATVITLRKVKQIDYATISILNAIADDLKARGIILQGDFPENTDCKKFIADSGFLNQMFDGKSGKRFAKAEKSDMIFFEKGSGILSQSDNMKITQLVKNVVNHLTGESKHFLPMKTIILEICGNSIEWGGTDNKQWLLGVKYEDDSVIFTIVDVGKGILKTLHRKFTQIIADLAISDDQVLKGAFEKKYGSSTREVNRNKGLPAIKASFDEGIIQNLKVLTNNVILHFDNESRSRQFNGAPRFKGTFYQWTMTKDCISKLAVKRNENY